MMLVPVMSTRPPAPPAPDVNLKSPPELSFSDEIAATINCPASIGRRGGAVPLFAAACAKNALPEVIAISEYCPQTDCDWTLNRLIWAARLPDTALPR